MSKRNFDFSQASSAGGSPHDFFGRMTIGDPLIAADLLWHYGDAVVREHIDLDNLQAEPTHFFGPAHPLLGAKEVVLDVPFVAHLRDKAWKSEVLIITEHKSSPSLAVPLQLGVQAMLSLYKRWTNAGRPAGFRTFKPPIPLMVLLYCGAEDLADETMRFQDIFDHIPEPLRPFVPQFRLVVINLRRFSYEHLPGKPETQAVVETMKRAFDGTLAKCLPGVLSRLETIPIDDRIMELIGSIAWYGGCVTDIGAERIVELVTNTIKGKEGIKMAETIQKGVFQQGKLEGRVEGRVTEKINDIQKLLRFRFNPVPEEIVDELNGRTDLVALDSLFEVAYQCQSLDEFADALK